MELRKLNHQSTPCLVIEKLLTFGNFTAEELQNTDITSIPLYKQLESLCRKQEKLTFILPAFPAKSSNRNKTSGVMPDLGELIRLVALDQFCYEIKKLYSPGAEVIICSDGRVFNDLVFVGDHELNLYKNKINDIIIEKI